MKISAVICEYNPLHNGHKYLNQAAKNNCDGLVAIMSTSFTQRGDVAVCDKYQRTKAALLNGADLVVELPVVYAVSNAQCFAQAGVSIASGLGCVDSLVFGSECADTQKLTGLANITQNADVQNIIKQKMSDGLYYPRALNEAIAELYPSDYADIISMPNDILAVEYIKALQNTGIKPAPIKRIAIDHDSYITAGEFCSASNIRNLLKNNCDISNFIPTNTEYSNFAFIENIYNVMLYKLRSISLAQLASLPDVTEGLENRIYSAVRSQATIPDVINQIKTKRYTLARIRRILISALLDITKELQLYPVPYIRVLGFNKKGTEILSLAKSTATLPICTKVTNLQKILADNQPALDILQREIYATDVFALAQENPQNCGADFYNQIVTIK